MKRLLFILFVIAPGALSAQEMDSVVLEELVFSAPKFTKYSAGAKVVKLEESNRAGNLNDEMEFLPSITFKNYGNGGLSTIAFRGTSASHTQLMWNGIPVNSPTLGQSDFSLFPAFMMDEITVQYGSTSALTGSGAIGGTVSMENVLPVFSKNTQTNFTLGYGSFGRVFTGIKTHYGNERFQGKTKIYRRSISNNFPYPEKGSNRTLEQENAAVRSYGLEQQFHAKISENQLFSITGFYNFNYREVQPSVASMGNDETLQNDNTRVVASYNNHSKIGFFETKIAYVLNDQLYNKTSRIQSEQWSSLINWDKDIGIATTLRVGVNHHYIIPKTKSHTIDAQENRTELYTSVKQQIRPDWELSVSLRQSIYDGELAPFTPSLGQEYTFQFGTSKLLLKNRLGRAYRIPTLNDRFWAEGGNPNIKPEQSWNLEFGGQWIVNSKNNTFSSEVTLYHQSVDNWIQWTSINTGVWTPENVQQVEVEGIEFTSKYTIVRVRHTFKLMANYSFTNSIIKEDMDESFVNNLLPYVAQNNANISAKWETSTWMNSLSARYAGKRFIEKSNNEFQSIKGFVLIDYKVNRKVSIQKINMNLSAEVKNILNVYYEQLKNHAMPGRNYKINLSINI